MGPVPSIGVPAVVARGVDGSGNLEQAGFRIFVDGSGILVIDGSKAATGNITLCKATVRGVANLKFVGANCVSGYIRIITGKGTRRPHSRR
jgi:hypothetical protein